MMLFPDKVDNQVTFNKSYQNLPICTRKLTEPMLTKMYQTIPMFKLIYESISNRICKMF